MRTAVDQLPLFRRLRMPKKPPPEPPRWWLPVSWSKAVSALVRLRQLDLHLPQRRKPQNRVKFTIDPKSLPFDVKPSKVIWMIQNHPPPKPLCYDTLQRWKDDLMHMHTEGIQLTRRQDTGKWKTVDGRKVRIKRVITTVFDRIDFCEGCPADWRKKMQGEKRCIVPAEATP